MYIRVILLSNKLPKVHNSSGWLRRKE